jgi:hypothetical protein
VVAYPEGVSENANIGVKVIIGVQWLASGGFEHLCAQLAFLLLDSRPQFLDFRREASRLSDSPGRR